MENNSGIFWAIIFSAVIWLIVLFIVFRQLATRTDISVVAKAFWILVIFMAPVVGLIAYLVIGKRSVKRKST